MPGVAVEWAEAASAVRARVRDRFRVAVDRHRQSRLAGRNEVGGSAAVRRWIARLRAVLGKDVAGTEVGAAAGGVRFYRKKVVKVDSSVDDSVIVRFLQALAVPLLGNACHVFMHGLNYIEIHGVEKLHKALLERPNGTSLITVSNHVASIDDPFVIASLLPPSAMLDARNIRWTMCATDRCFTNPVISAFFRCVKVLPVSRGDGIYQEGMDIALSKLNDGGWVHIFPEGSRSRDGGKTIGPIKRGVGRMVMDTDSIPMVVPFVHTGMQDVMPIGSHLPQTGKKVIVVVGDPISFDDLLVHKDDAHLMSKGILYDEVSSRVGQQLQELKRQVDELTMEQPSASNIRQNLHGAENEHLLAEHVDWEAFGMIGPMTVTDTSKPLLKQLHKQPENKTEAPSWQKAPQDARAGYFYEGGIISRVRGYMDPAELMGFAARGLFTQGRFMEESSPDVAEVIPQHYRNVQGLAPWDVWRSFIQKRSAPSLSAA